jgi:predicted CXXCH cytochrome family protein
MTRLATGPAAIRAAIGVSLSVGALLFLAAAPVLADGGPHVASANSGATSLSADGCAGCHRAHTGQGSNLLAQPDEEALCLACHGAAGTGATTDVEDGVQYALGVGGGRNDAVLAGALRSGGFLEARIDSSDPSRISYPRLFFGAYATWFSAEVPVLDTGQPTTSAHLHLDGATFAAAPGIAWGNGGTGSGVGASVDLTCASCHNPHGNGQYRILNPIPGDGTGAMVEAGTDATVTDAALPTGSDASGTRNYTVQWGRTLADVLAGTYTGGTADPTAGDYWRRYLPWDGVPGWNGTAATPASGSFGDKPMYVPGGANLTSYRAQITAWCSACHTRYDQVTGAQTDTGDPIFRYRHDVGQNECTQCHVAHGSNALMAGDGSTSFSADYPYPDGTTSASSRLLKIDNRGTCQACHDPTGTVPFTNVVTP